MSELRCIMCSGCLCCPVSLKSRPNPGLLVLDILAGNGSLAPMQISPLFLFKKNTRGPTNTQHRMLYRHAATLTQLCPVLQSGRKCSSCASPPRIWPSWTQAGRDVILKQEFCCAAAHRLDSMIAHTPPSLRRAPPCARCPLPLMKCNL